MESSPIERIEAFCVDKHIGSLTELGRLIGANAGTFSIIKKRNRPPGTKVMDLLTKKFPDLSSEWVLYGIGSMYRNEQRLTPVEQAATTKPVATSEPVMAEEPAPAYGCLAPDLVSTLRLENADLRAENKALNQELRQARAEFRADFIAQARQYNSVKIGQEELIQRLYTKLDEYELRLGYRQPTEQERQRLQGGTDTRMEVKPFGARYREASDEPQATLADEPGCIVVEMYPAEYSLAEAA